MVNKNAVFGIYPTRAGADLAVERLRTEGFRDIDVSVLDPRNVGHGESLGPLQARGSSKMRALLALGQSVWLDDLSRDLTRSGQLQALIDAGLRGMTSNPTIFAQAIAGSSSYDVELAELTSSSATDRDVFEALAVTDVREAADLFRDVYDATNGTDGFVSVEVSPDVAHDTIASLVEARRLWQAVARVNIMVKIPGTREGWLAIERCLYEGININITLLFSQEHYEAVSEAYLRALEARLRDGLPIDTVASVASFFVSRVDTEVDRRLQSLDRPLLELQGKAAIAGAQLAYLTFLETSRSARWRALEAKGAKPQRLLWASTGTKNPAYSDVRYVESLIGPQTIATIPPDTLDLFEEHGRVVDVLSHIEASDARAVIDALSRAAIDFDDVTGTLETEGIEKFKASVETVLGVIAAKRASRLAH
jgi:transaldolase